MTSQFTYPPCSLPIERGSIRIGLAHVRDDPRGQGARLSGRKAPRPDRHYEGENLFRDTAIVEMTPPQQEGNEWSVKLGWMSNSDGVATKKLKYLGCAHSRLISQAESAIGTINLYS
jgi:hypothetical protein